MLKGIKQLQNPQLFPASQFFRSKNWRRNVILLVYFLQSRFCYTVDWKAHSSAFCRLGYLCHGVRSFSSLGMWSLLCKGVRSSFYKVSSSTLLRCFRIRYFGLITVLVFVKLFVILDSFKIVKDNGERSIHLLLVFRVGFDFFCSHCWAEYNFQPRNHSSCSLRREGEMEWCDASIPHRKGLNLIIHSFASQVVIALQVYSTSVLLYFLFNLYL